MVSQNGKVSLSFVSIVTIVKHLLGQLTYLKSSFTSIFKKPDLIYLAKIEMNLTHEMKNLIDTQEHHLGKNLRR